MVIKNEVVILSLKIYNLLDASEWHPNINTIVEDVVKLMNRSYGDTRANFRLTSYYCLSWL